MTQHRYILPGNWTTPAKIKAAMHKRGWHYVETHRTGMLVFERMYQ